MGYDSHDHGPGDAPTIVTTMPQSTGITAGTHGHSRGHGHSHGVVDPSIASNERGLRALNGRSPVSS